jgi:hypothetical protein
MTVRSEIAQSHCEVHGAKNNEVRDAIALAREKNTLAWFLVP